MDLKERIEVLGKLGDRLLAGDEYLDAVIHRTNFNNKWFSKENQQRRIKAIAENFLNREKLESWVKDYEISETVEKQKIALIPADYEPLSLIYDIISVFVSGNISLVKLSKEELYLFPCLIKFLKEINPKTEEYFQAILKLDGFDGVIAEIDDKSEKTFSTYFGKKPHLFRKKKNSIAILDGSESDAELLKLGNDIFMHFGRTSKNVSKIYLPHGYYLKHLLEVLHEFKSLVLNNKYKNNFDYNFSLYALNQIPFNINGCIILVEKKDINSRVGALNYEFYKDLNEVKVDIEKNKGEIENIVGKEGILPYKITPFGKSNLPDFSDFHGENDALKFLTTF